jgi:uncharacterized protein (DUF433 family)
VTGGEQAAEGSRKPSRPCLSLMVGFLRTTFAYAGCMAFTRIKIDHRIMGGVPCIAGTRVPVAMIVRMIAAGTTVETILDQYPQLVEDDIREALRFAAANVDQHVIPLDQSA